MTNGFRITVPYIWYVALVTKTPIKAVRVIVKGAAVSCEAMGAFLVLANLVQSLPRTVVG
jgi:hypothetical protein